MGSLTSFNLSHRVELLVGDNKYRFQIGTGYPDKCRSVNSSSVKGEQSLGGKSSLSR